MISFGCPCGKGYTVKDQLAGKRTKCPACRGAIVVPDAQIAFQDSTPNWPVPYLEEASARKPPGRRKAAEVDESEAAPADRRPAPDRPRCPAARQDRQPWEYACRALVLTLIPLGFSLLSRGEDSTERRLARPFEKAPESVRDRYQEVADAEDGGDDLDSLLPALPGGRIEGARLPRGAQFRLEVR
jgi:hypothetical protein